MPSEKEIKEERSKARELRKSRWWINKISHNCKCYYCDKDLEKSEVTMDHVVPVSKGGKSTKNNVVPCCKECNNQKKHLGPVDWVFYLEKLKNS